MLKLIKEKERKTKDFIEINKVRNTMLGGSQRV